MSKPPSKSNTTNAKIMGTKQREPSKERKINRSSVIGESVNTPTTKTKTKPAVKMKDAVSSKTNVTKTVKSESNKAETKTKPDNRVNNSTVTKKVSPTVNKTATSTRRSNLVKSKRSTAPDTPPSNRVTKTQYFPSKNLYSNAVKEHLRSKENAEKLNKVKDTELAPSKEDKRTKALDHTKLKIIKNNSEAPSKPIKKPNLLGQKHDTPNTSFINIERPKTATLRKGSIVNSNIAGPDIPKSETPSLTSLDLSFEQDIQQEDNDDYEDDFDSYESDFEEYHSSSSTSPSSSENVDLLEGEDSTTSEDTSSSAKTSPKQGSSAGTDEERMLDSGNFDMPDNKHKQLLDNITESNEHVTVALTEINRSNMASLSDEGFEDGKASLQSGANQFINFADAQRKWKQNKNVEKLKKRGEEILNMIKLDYYNFTLLDMPPVSYNVFIRSYGKTNTAQVSSQTGDNNISEEVQTDQTEVVNKWTQFPAVFSKIDTNKLNYLELYKQEYAGVGSDTILAQDYHEKQDFNNNKRLEKFLTGVGQTVVNILEESQFNISDKIENNSRDIPFSNGYLKFNAKSLNFLKNRPISFVTYCSTTNIQILTVHGRNVTITSNDDDVSVKSILCIWSVLNTEKPVKVLSVTGELNCCCFVTEFKNVIVGGLYDGSLTIWDMDEYSHSQNTPVDLQKRLNYFQEPDFTTEIDCGHICKIVALQQILNTSDDIFNNIKQRSSNYQICSLDESGVLIIWSIIVQKNSTFNVSVNSNITPWSQVSLIQNSKISLKSVNPELTNLLCTDMSTSVLDPHHIFISTNYGCVLHCLTTGTKTVPKKYNPVTISQANCLEICPFSPLYFIAGYENGEIVFYSRLLEKPLIVMSNKDDDSVQGGIEILQWSYTKPCVFYTKDHYNTIHIWDLTISDLYPVYSVPFKENITCMKLSPTIVKNSDTSYMILATDDGLIHLHVLNFQYGPSDSEQYQQDVKKFLNYVSRL